MNKPDTRDPDRTTGGICIHDFIEEFKSRKQSTDGIRPEMIPDIDLYMDQVTTFMEQHLGPDKRYSDDKILTKTMINNYTKNDLLPPPVKKKYSRNHILLLTFIYYFKNILSINDIQKLLGPVTKKYFHNSQQSIRLEDIYREVYTADQTQTQQILQEICDRYERSRNDFANIDDPGDKEQLQDFTFLCALIYDISLKKQLVEQIIDQAYASGSNADESK